MQRQFTMEMRVDFADADKNEAFQEAIQHIGRHALATMQLLSDGQKPQIAIWSDDFYAGRKEIMLFDDLLKSESSKDSPDVAQDASPSDEMLRAMRGD